MFQPFNQYVVEAACAGDLLTRCFTSVPPTVSIAHVSHKYIMLKLACTWKDYLDISHVTQVTEESTASRSVQSVCVLCELRSRTQRQLRLFLSRPKPHLNHIPYIHN